MVRLGILFIHGIGDNQDIEDSSFTERVNALIEALRPRFDPGQFEQVAFETVIWQDLIQRRQDEIYDNVSGLTINNDGLVRSALNFARLRGFRRAFLRLFSRALRRILERAFPAVRRLLVSSLGDASAIEHRAHLENSVYTRIQERIRDGLNRIYTAAGNTPVPVFILSQSYGAHLISNYIWDVQVHRAELEAGRTNEIGYGIWRYDVLPGESQDRLDFLQLRTLEHFFSAANNMALFLSGLDRIQPFVPPSDVFHWTSFWDTNDVLGWPLKTLRLPSHTPERPFDEIVDEEFNLGMSGVFTHNSYWEQPGFIDPLETAMRGVLDRGEVPSEVAAAVSNETALPADAASP